MTEPMSRLAIYLLGPPRVELEGEPVHIGRTKAVALLAYLSLEPGRHSRDALATLLWPAFDQSGARAELRRALSTLNRALGSDILLTDREMAGLNPAAGVWIDAEEFRRLLAASDACEGDHTRDEVCPDCQDS